MWPGVSEAPVFYLSVAGAWRLVFFPHEGRLGKRMLKHFYIQSNITNKLDESEMKKVADYVLSVEI